MTFGETHLRGWVMTFTLVCQIERQRKTDTLSMLISNLSARVKFTGNTPHPLLLQYKGIAWRQYNVTYTESQNLKSDNQNAESIKPNPKPVRNKSNSDHESSFPYFCFSNCLFSVMLLFLSLSTSTSFP